MWGSTPGCPGKGGTRTAEGAKGCCDPLAPLPPPAGKEPPFRVPPCRKTAREGRAAPLIPSPPLGLGRRDVPPGASTRDPGSITSPHPAASPPAPSCPSTGRGIKERRAEKKPCGASPSCCCSPRHPPSPPDRKKPTSPCAPPARGWECGSNCTWQGSNSESKTVVWLVSHPGPAALLFAFAFFNPFQPWPLSPAGPSAPSPAARKGLGAREKPCPTARLPCS